jgi:tRNA-(ms[2]io[6]A)-hydroxylase
MLGLKLVTDPLGKYSRIEHWGNFDRPCLGASKAASNAISLITKPRKEDLVTELMIIARGTWTLTNGAWLNKKIKFKFRTRTQGTIMWMNYSNSWKKDGSRNDVCLCERLLFSAMIEARSCERFKVLSENIKDTELANFIAI